MFEISQIEARVADHRRDVARADLAAQLPVHPTLRARASRLGRAVTYRLWTHPGRVARQRENAPGGVCESPLVAADPALEGTLQR